MPRGSPNSKNCTLKLLNPNLPTINLFKVTRVKAWWPFEQSVNAGQYIQAVCIYIYMKKIYIVGLRGRNEDSFVKN